MTQSRARLIGTAAAAAAAGSMLLIPAVAHADGTKDPRYSHPPKKSQPKKSQPKNTQPCNQETKSGQGQKVSRTTHSIGRGGPTSFQFTYDTWGEEDSIEIRYEGKTIWSTGGPVGTNGDKTATVTTPAGSATYVTVVVTPKNSRTTLWKFTVHCPQ
ncbi:hypothetical protein [Gordonia iterans]